MASNKSTLSRRELFGRLVGRSRSETMAERAPDEHPASLRADELLHSGDFQAAGELYARLVLQAPDFNEAYRRLAWCHLRLGRTSEARQALEQLLEREPADATSLLYIGLSHAMDGAAEHAVTVWRDVHDYNRIVVQREVNLILFLHDSGDTPGPEDLSERIQRVIEEQNRMPGSQGVYF